MDPSYPVNESGKADCCLPVTVHSPWKSLDNLVERVELLKKNLNFELLIETIKIKPSKLLQFVITKIFK
jgi:hypothetical protein